MGSEARRQLDGVMQRLRQQARDAGKKAVARSGAGISSFVMPSRPWGPPRSSPFTAVKAALRGLFVAPDVFRADPIRQQLSHVAVSAQNWVWLIGAARLRPRRGLATGVRHPSRPVDGVGVRSEPEQQGRQSDADHEAEHPQQRSPERFFTGVEQRLGSMALAYSRPMSGDQPDRETVGQSFDAGW